MGRVSLRSDGPPADIHTGKYAVQEETRMGLDWLSSYGGDDLPLDNELVDSFYCPYTNKAECALMTKGWQPRELCHAVECDQMRHFRATHKSRKRAA